MGFSINEYTYSGNPEFDINFALGFASDTDVSCVKIANPPVAVPFDWVGPSRVRVQDAELLAGDTLRFYRTVSKNTLPVDLTQPNRLTREDVDTALRHSIYMMHEVLDGRVAAFSDVSDVATQTVADIVRQAIEDTDLLVSKKYPLVIHGSTSSALLFVAPVGFQSTLDEVTVQLDGAPSVTTEFVLTSGADEVLVIEVFQDGTYAVRTPSGDDTFRVTKGAIRLATRNGNYYTGSIAIGINGVDTDIISTTEDFPDFYLTYTNARDAGTIDPIPSPYPDFADVYTTARYD